MDKFNKPEKFDPSKPEYKKVEDLPRAFREDFINTEDKTGFVKKEADEGFLQATRKADQNIKYGKTEGLTATDVLNEDALNDEKFIEKIIKEKEFGGIMGKEDINMESWEEDMLGRREVTKGTKGKDVTNELYDKGVLSKGFFERLADAGVVFSNPHNSIPRELMNDKEFLLKLVKNTKTELSLDLLSERIQQDNDFLFMLIMEAIKNYNHTLYYRDREEIIKNYFTGKDSATVVNWLIGADFGEKYIGERVIGIYENLPESLKKDKDVVRTILEKAPEVSVYNDFLKDHEIMSISLEVLKKMLPNEHIKNFITMIEQRFDESDRNTGEKIGRIRINPL